MSKTTGLERPPPAAMGKGGININAGFSSTGVLPGTSRLKKNQAERALYEFLGSKIRNGADISDERGPFALDPRALQPP